MIRLAIVLLVACGTDNKGSTDGETDETAETDTTEDTDTGEPVEEDVLRLFGTITDVEGNPLGDDDVRVQWCLPASTCYIARQETAGTYEFYNLPDSNGAFEVVPLAGTGLSTPFVPIILANGDVREVNVVVPPIGEGAELTATEEYLELSGLAFFLSTSSFTTPTFKDPATEIGVVQAAGDEVLPVDGVDGEVLGMWFVEPFEYAAASPDGLMINVENQWELSSGEAQLYVGSYIAADWELVGPLNTGKGWMYVDAPTGLPRFSTLLIVRTPVE